MVLGAGIEPARPQGTQDFKSCASTYSATQARGKDYHDWRRSSTEATAKIGNSAGGGGGDKLTDNCHTIGVNRLFRGILNGKSSVDSVDRFGRGFDYR